jgi:MYXO-CTERM domain-containing protein
MRRLRIFSSTAAALLLAVLARRADASPTFPAAITSDLSLTYTLGASDCIICHNSLAGGIGTVVHPFGLAMKAAGLQLENLASLQTALNTLEANKTDSDCDGTPDIEQIKMGRDPNAPGEYLNGSSMTAPVDPGCTGADAGADAVLVPAYGCAAQLSRAPAAWPSAVAVIALFGALSGQRRRNRKTRRP